MQGTMLYGPRDVRFIAGADAIAVAEQKVQDLQQQINAYRDLSTSMALGAMQPCTAVDEWPRSIERANQIDTTYRTKYRCYGDRFISLMISPEARAATIKALLRP